MDLFKKLRFFGLCACIVVAFNDAGTYGQGLVVDKSRLETLTAELRRLDATLMQKAGQIEGSIATKGEFETTAQFETREKEGEESARQIRREISYQDGPVYDKIYREISSIISKSYRRSFGVRVGTYDADRQRFPLFVNDKPNDFLSVPLANAPEVKGQISDALTDGRVALSVDENDSASEYLIEGTIQIGARVYRVPTSTLNVTRAMLIAFGNFDTGRMLSRLRLSQQNYGDDATVRPVEITETFAGLGRLLPIGTGGTRQLLLTISSPSSDFSNPADFSCHGCGVILSAAVFRKDGSGWRMEQLKKQIVVNGGWGDGPIPKLMSLGQEKPTLWFDLSYMQMGYSSSWVELIAIENNQIRRIAYIETGADNLGAVSSGKEMESYKSTVEVLSGVTTEHLPIKVSTTGRKAKRVGKRYVLAPFKKTTIYEYKDGKYRPRTN